MPIVGVRRSGQGNGRATAGQRQGGNAGVGAGPGHKPSTKLDITSDDWINSRLNLLTPLSPRPRSLRSTDSPPSSLSPLPFYPFLVRPCLRIGCERARKILASRVTKKFVLVYISNEYLDCIFGAKSRIENCRVSYSRNKLAIIRLKSRERLILSRDS